MENPNNPTHKDNLADKSQNATTPADQAGLTKEDGINAFKSNQDKEPRPEDILFTHPDDIENAEDIISGGVGSE